ncbi:MAG: hypothetical protein H6891_10615 [Brucellaceae bacterium]|nr:hypothetical protein [Brucellaceae bacterium]
MSDMSQTALVWMAKGTGAAAGSALSLIYMLPVGRREDAARFCTPASSPGWRFRPTAGLPSPEGQVIVSAWRRRNWSAMGSAAAKPRMPGGDLGAVAAHHRAARPMHRKRKDGRK